MAAVAISLPPGVLDDYRDAEVGAEVPDGAGPRQPADLRYLEVDEVHRVLLVAAKHGLDARHHLLEHKRVVGLAADRATRLVGRARLLDVDIHVADRVDDANRLVLGEAGVEVRIEDVVRVELVADRADALGVRDGASPTFS